MFDVTLTIYCFNDINDYVGVPELSPASVPSFTLPLPQHVTAGAAEPEVAVFTAEVLAELRPGGAHYRKGVIIGYTDEHLRALRIWIAEPYVFPVINIVL